MGEKFFPFRSVSGDRKYSAEDWAAYFALFLSNGVFYSNADKLKVVTGEGMKVKVNKGAAFVNGRGYRLETDKFITLDTADGVLNRIDRIVLRCDYTNRLITVAVKKGSYNQKPVAKELTRDADVYELALADVYVAAGVVEITAANITDQRLNTTLCGIVTGLVDQADTTEIFNQFQAYMLEFEEAKEEEFNIWFNTMKTVLEGDVAGNLQNQITSLQQQTGDTAELKTTNKTNLVAAINEVADEQPEMKSQISSLQTIVGTLSNLKTTIKTNLVNAINEVVDKATSLQSQITSVKNQIGTISSLKTSIKTNLVAAINEIYAKEPDLLDTLEEVAANTKAGKHVDALVVKEINDSLANGQVKFKVENGDLYYSVYTE